MVRVNVTVKPGAPGDARAGTYHVSQGAHSTFALHQRASGANDEQLRLDWPTALPLKGDGFAVFAGHGFALRLVDGAVRAYLPARMLGVLAQGGYKMLRPEHDADGNVVDGQLVHHRRISAAANAAEEDVSAAAASVDSALQFLRDNAAAVQPFPWDGERLLERLRSGNPWIDTIELEPAAPTRVAGSKLARASRRAAAGDKRAAAEVEEARREYEEAQAAALEQPTQEDVDAAAVGAKFEDFARTLVTKMKEFALQRLFGMVKPIHVGWNNEQWLTYARAVSLEDRLRLAADFCKRVHEDHPHEVPMHYMNHDYEALAIGHMAYDQGILDAAAEWAPEWTEDAEVRTVLTAMARRVVTALREYASKAPEKCGCKYGKDAMAALARLDASAMPLCKLAAFVVVLGQIAVDVGRETGDMPDNLAWSVRERLRERAAKRARTSGAP